MPRTLVLIALFVATGLPAQTGFEARDEKIDLRVLMTGREEGTRRAEFVDFLRLHFKKVGAVSYSDFKPSDADGYDVVVFDAEIVPEPGRIGLPRRPQLPEDFARASVLVSGGGAGLARGLKIKTDWG